MKRAITFLILGFIYSVPVAAAQEKPGDAEKLGNVHFAVSCLPATQPQFDRAVAMLHSFWYPQGLNAFAEIAKTDPCERPARRPQFHEATEGRSYSREGA